MDINTEPIKDTTEFTKISKCDKGYILNNNDYFVNTDNNIKIHLIDMLQGLESADKLYNITMSDEDVLIIFLNHKVNVEQSQYIFNNFKAVMNDKKIIILRNGTFDEIKSMPKEQAIRLLN